MKKSRKHMTKNIQIGDLKPKKNVKGGWFSTGVATQSSTPIQSNSQPTENVTLNFIKTQP